MVLLSVTTIRGSKLAIAPSCRQVSRPYIHKKRTTIYTIIPCSIQARVANTIQQNVGCYDRRFSTNPSSYKEEFDFDLLQQQQQQQQQVGGELWNNTAAQFGYRVAPPASFPTSLQSHHHDYTSHMGVGTSCMKGTVSTLGALYAQVGYVPAHEEFLASRAEWEDGLLDHEVEQQEQQE